MNEELLNQIRDVLAKNGVDEEVIEKSLTELTGEPSQEEPVDDVVEEQIEEPVDEIVDEMPATDEEEEAVVDEVADEPTVEQPVVEQPEPAFNPEELFAKIDEQNGTIGELNKALEGLLARISSLEEALKGAGVIDKQAELSNTLEVKPNAPGIEDTGNPMDNFLAKVRNHKRY